MSSSPRDTNAIASEEKTRGRERKNIIRVPMRCTSSNTRMKRPGKHEEKHQIQF